MSENIIRIETFKNKLSKEDKIRTITKENVTDKKQNMSKKLKKFGLCDYQCKKKSAFEKHIINNHTREKSLDSKKKNKQRIFLFTRKKRKRL